MPDLSLPASATGSPIAERLRVPSRRASLRVRLQRLLTIELDLRDIGIDEPTLHADLADLFERGDG